VNSKRNIVYTYAIKEHCGSNWKSRNQRVPQLKLQPSSFVAVRIIHDMLNFMFVINHGPSESSRYHFVHFFIYNIPDRNLYVFASSIFSSLSCSLDISSEISESRCCSASSQSSDMFANSMRTSVILVVGLTIGNGLRERKSTCAMLISFLHSTSNSNDCRYAHGPLVSNLSCDD